MYTKIFPVDAKSDAKSDSWELIYNFSENVVEEERDNKCSDLITALVSCVPAIKTNSCPLFFQFV